MENPLILIALIITLLPLVGAIVAGLFGNALGNKLTDYFSITLVAIAFGLSCYLFKVMVINHHAPLDNTIYTWASSGPLKFDVAFLLDPLSVTMMSIVLFVSLMVHIYSMGYMADDPGHTRFFSYVSLFTFAMLILVLADNFLLLFFGWEGVGLVSYLLIGFWYDRESANVGSLKAFIVNRIGDIGFILATAAVLFFFGTLNYHDVFQQVPTLINRLVTIFPQVDVHAITLVCLLLFFAAMAKSAQVPLHVWLPESMEGPTPISALIHAATMVTAGIYMVARMSPLFEYSPTTLTIILVLGGTTALFMGLVALVENDIKRVIAYSTISQLGYMAVALGASAYSAAIFHLITHAFFKALLFLAAGSVIVALHHEQDMRKMGQLARKLPITYLSFLIGALALSAVPPFSGFFSKDTIIEAVHLSNVPGASYAYWCVLLGALITPIYIFRAFFMTFHTTSRIAPDLRNHIHEPSWSILLPLVFLAIPSVIAGQYLIQPILFNANAFLNTSIFVLPEHNVIRPLAQEFQGASMMSLEAGKSLAFWLSIFGIGIAWLFVAKFPQWATDLKKRFSLIYSVLVQKYGFDYFNQIIFVRGTQETSQLLYEVGDVKIIDNTFVNGSGRFIQWFARTIKLLQTGYIYHYALAMILGVLIFTAWYIRGL